MTGNKWQFLLYVIKIRISIWAHFKSDNIRPILLVINVRKLIDQKGGTYVVCELVFALFREQGMDSFQQTFVEQVDGWIGGV